MKLCACGDRKYLATFKQVSKLFFQMRVHVYSLLDQAEGGRKVFLEGDSKRGAVWYYPQEHLVVIRD